MHGIGRVARDSGLTVSALRFYDAAGVLVPAYVDPDSGYRRYTDDQVGLARIVARLRRVGMPVVDIRTVVADPHDRSVIDDVLDRHLRQLDDGLADARRELSAVRDQLDRTEKPMTSTQPTTITMSADHLADALRAVRYAVSGDAELPMLTGVLLDVADGTFTVVASDRYRLAVSTVPTERVDGPSAAAIAPVGLIDDLLVTLSRHAGPITVTLDAGEVSVRGTGGLEHDATGLDQDFPDYRRLLRTTRPHGVHLDAASVRAEAATAPSSIVRDTDKGTDRSVVALGVDDGVLTFGPVDDEGRVLVNREFLLQAIEASGATQLTLELDGPIAPLAIRHPQRDGDVALLMPVHLP